MCNLCVDDLCMVIRCIFYVHAMEVLVVSKLGSVSCVELGVLAVFLAFL